MPNETTNAVMQQPASQSTQPPATQPPEATKLSHSERFTNRVMLEFNSNIAGGLQINDHMRQLITGYFIGVDRALEVAEENRINKNKNNTDRKYDNPLPCVWENVNLKDLALDVVHYARMGLDMMQENHLSPIPFRNKKNNTYDITLMPGYNGIQYIAEKYAVEKPLATTVELVYTTDIFKPIKKNCNNKVESYEFEIVTPFARGEVVGGFGYIEYSDPAKNKLIIMTLADILKRKPSYAAAEFWGGKSTKWENNKRVEVELDGWKEEMYLKTLKREVYSAKHMPRDPKKIDDNYQFMKMREARIAEMGAQDEIYEHANMIPIDVTPATPLLEPGEIPNDNTVDGGEQIAMTTTEEQPTGGPDF